MLTGDSGEDAIELLCTAIVAEDVLSATYQFTWIKDDTPIDLSDNRIIVRTYMQCACLALAMYASTAINKLITIVQVADNNNTSSFVIKATDSNATLDNGIYRCAVTLTISGVNSFSKTSQISTVLYKGMTSYSNTNQVFY